MSEEVVAKMIATPKISFEKNVQDGKQPESSFHTSWGSFVTKRNSGHFSIPPPEEIAKLELLDYNNEYNLSEEDRNKFAGKLETQTIVQFLKRAEEKNGEDVTFDIRDIATVSPNRPQPFQPDELPDSYTNYSFEYLQITMNPITVHGSSVPLSGYTGILFLYDASNKTPISEVAHFSAVGNQIIFENTKTDVIYFEKANTDCVLVSILYHATSSNFDGDPSAMNFAGPGSPIPFATSFANIKEASSDISFNFSWLVLANPEDLFKMGSTPASDDRTVMMISKFSLKYMKESELESYGTLFNPVVDRPLLMKHLQARIFDPQPIISLYNLSFTFPSTPSGLSCFFRVYLCEEQGDPNTPIGLQGFVGQAGMAFSDSYTSSHSKPAKRLMFPDVVRFMTNKPLGPNAHLLIHFYTLSDRGTSSLAAVGVIPLLDKDTNLNGLKQYPTAQGKSLKPGDYIQRSKTGRKSSMSAIVDMPPAFFPPEELQDLEKAQVPMQVNWDDISNTPKEILRVHFLPIIAKFLSIIAPQTATYMMKLLKMFTGDRELILLLKSWVFHSFDPNTLKHNFLSAFTNSLDQLIVTALEGDVLTMQSIVNNFDILAEIALAAFMQKSETWVPASLFSLITSCSLMTRKLINSGSPFVLSSFNEQFGRFVWKLSSLLDQRTMRGLLNTHLRSLLELKSTPALCALFEFLMPFTRTTEFVIFCSTQLAVRPLTATMFSPFHPTLSLIFLAFSRSLTSSDQGAIALACEFLARLCLPVESLPPRMRFRVGFALFPFLDILSSSYETMIPHDLKVLLVPATLFLLGYTPRQLLKNFFSSVSANFQSHIVSFMESVTEACISQLTEGITVVNGQFDELTKRVLMFLGFNIPLLGDSMPQVMSLIARLTVSKHQHPRNYPRIFDLAQHLVRQYHCQRTLVANLLEMLSLKQHIARCYATALLLIFFKKDYDQHHSVVVSSVEFIDELTTLCLRQEADYIPMVKLLLVRISEISPYFKSETLSQKLKERLVSANKIADVIDAMKHVDHESADMCEYVMQIANQNKTFPSMRMKWLTEIVSINERAGSFTAAFVAQCHVCALIATVIEHEQRIATKTPPVSAPPVPNLLVTQPIRLSRQTGGRAVVLTDKDFAFIPSILIETKIDFESISEDFQFIASDFTLQLLKDSLARALELGTRAKMYYSMRWIRSLQIRIYAIDRQYKELATVCRETQQIFDNLSVTLTSKHDSPIAFYRNGTRIVYADNDQVPNMQQFERVIPYDPDTETVVLEHPHAWQVFRSKVTPELLDVVNCDDQAIPMAQYTTKHFLPRYTTFSEITEKRQVKISLRTHAELESDRLCSLMRQCSAEFERCFPCRNVKSVCGPYTQNIERDLYRVVALLNAAVGDGDSMFSILKMLDLKGGKDTALELAGQLRLELQRLVKLYHRAIEYLESEDHFMSYGRATKQIESFTSFFGLGDIDTKSYEGRRDPLAEKLEYE